MIERFFVWPISVRRTAGQNANNPLFSAWDTTIKARIKVESAVSIDEAGNEVLVAATLSMSADTPRIPPGSKVTLPVEFGGTTSTVVAEGLHDSGLSNLPRYYQIQLG